MSRHHDALIGCRRGNDLAAGPARFLTEPTSNAEPADDTCAFAAARATRAFWISVRSGSAFSLRVPSFCRASNEDGQTLFDLSPTTEKDFFVVEGAGHYDMYYRPAYVIQAVDRLATFYSE